MLFEGKNSQSELDIADNLKYLGTCWSPVRKVLSAQLRKIFCKRHQLRHHLTNNMSSETNGREFYSYYTNAIEAIFTTSILTATIKGSLSVITNCLEDAVVCFDGRPVDMLIRHRF